MAKRNGMTRSALLAVIVLIFAGCCAIPALAENLTDCPGDCNLTSIEDTINETDTSFLLADGVIEITAPAVIDTPGRYRLKNDLSNSTADTAISVTASDVYFDGYGHTLTGGLEPDTKGILAVNGENITITNLTVTGWDIGIATDGVENCTIENARSSGNINGMYLDNSPGCTILNCDVTDSTTRIDNGIATGGTGLYIGSSQGSRILDSDISNNGWGENLPYIGGTGIYASSNNDILISGCTINHNVNTGIWSDDSTDLVVQGNLLSGNSGNGGILSTSMTGEVSVNGIITDNIISGCTAGISLGQRDYVVTNNTVTDCLNGIFLEECSNATLTTNTMEGNEVNFLVESQDIEGYLHSVDTTNTVDGRPIYYLVGVSDAEVDITSNAGTIYGISCINLTIRDLYLENNLNGVFLFDSDQVALSNVTASQNYFGFVFLECSDIRVDACSAGKNSLAGFKAHDSESIRITQSEAIENTGSTESGTGIEVHDSYDILISDSHATSNNFAGIDIETSGQAAIVNVTADSNNLLGIILGGETIRMTGCTIRDNGLFGLGLVDSEDVSIYNNFFSNDENVDLSQGTTTNGSWNTTKTPGPNIAGGPFIGGNFWASPDGTGWSQVMPDRGDGFCNAPFVIDDKNVDLLPIHNRTKPAFYADFTATPVSGNAPLAVQFTDQSNGRPVQWKYQFGDGMISTSRNPKYTYRVPGTYNVSLTIYGIENGTLASTTTWKQAYITVTGSPVPDLAADFTASPTSGEAPLSVRFTDASTGDPIKYLYKFGDGLQSYSRNTTHDYKRPGNYTVSFTIWGIKNGKLVSNTSVQENLIIAG